jgi:arginase
MAAGDAALVLGGDCTLELGTVAGALRGEDSVGLVYIDLDSDLNPPEHSDGALDWTGVAHLLDLPDVASELSGLGRRRPMLAASDILFFAVDNITPVEAQTIRSLGLESIGLAEVSATQPALRSGRWHGLRNSFGCSCTSTSMCWLSIIFQSQRMCAAAMA